MSNPLLSWPSGPLQLPPFDRIEVRHFSPAFEQAMAQERAQVDRIANLTVEPTFDNTLLALERAGQLLRRVTAIFLNLVAAHTNDELDALRRELAPRLSAHRDDVLLNRHLYRRIQAVHQRLRSSHLDAESCRLVERYRLRFLRAGAELDESAKSRMRTINETLACLCTAFSQNVLAEANAARITVESPDELEGLSAAEIAQAAEEATRAGLVGGFALPLVNTSDQPVLARLEDRELRKRVYAASLARGWCGEFDNRALLSRIMKLRAERAELLGYSNHAAFELAEQSAGGAETVNAFLSGLARPALAKAREEADELQSLLTVQGHNFTLSGCDWSHFADKLRRERFALDDSELLPYFELENVLHKGVFHTANQLYGISFRERVEAATYHPDVRVFEVEDEAGDAFAMCLLDIYARPTKRGGAWMSSYRDQSNLLHDLPIVAAHLNVAKPSEGPTLLTFTEVVTLFHEFGHVFHGILSDVNYPFFSGTRVARDFVEFPSQVNEMWATEPRVLANYAVHYQTDEPLPLELLERFLAARQFNQGFATTEYLAACVLDQAWHQLGSAEVPDADAVEAFEARVLSEHGFDAGLIAPRYRSTYFSHIIGGYSAGYYGYIWAEVLDADAALWIRANGGLNRANGDHLRNTVLARGGSAQGSDLYRQFRGAEPDPGALLSRRSLSRAGSLDGNA